MTSREFQERLTERVTAAGLSVDTALGERLEAYFRLLATWNVKINLTALPLADPPPETFDRLLIEPLVAAQHVPATAKRMMDVGSGGGSPAIPLALACPQIELLMVESKTRKSVFLREAIRTLGLSGASVATARVEELLTRPDLHDAHELVTVRAVRIDPRLLHTLAAFLRTNGQLFLFMGPAIPFETPPPPFAWVASHALLDADAGRLAVLEKRST